MCCGVPGPLHDNHPRLATAAAIDSAATAAIRPSAARAPPGRPGGPAPAPPGRFGVPRRALSRGEKIEDQRTPAYAATSPRAFHVARRGGAQAKGGGA